MEAVWQIVALGLLGAVLAALLKKHTPELALLLAVAVCGAASLGIDCRVQVEVRTEDGLPLPYGASLDVERDQVLSDYMAQELGIPASRQSWQPEE